METTLISVLIGVGWTVAILIGIATFGLAEYVGTKYVNTALGVSRTGPSVGRSLAKISVESGKTGKTMGELASQSDATLVVFLSYQDVWNDLVNDLAMLSDRVKDLRILAFCRGECTRFQNQLAGYPDIEFFLLPETSDLIEKLTIRVLPFALLLDRAARVLSKGLVNGMIHICLLFDNSQRQFRIEAPPDIVALCRPLDLVIGSSTSNGGQHG